MSKKLVLEFDDLHWLEPENCISSIQELVKRHPNIKLNFFTVPFLRDNSILTHKEFYKEIHKYTENVNLGYHGFNHSTLEFKDLSLWEAYSRLKMASLLLYEFAGAQTMKIFRGPHWGINAEVINALKQLNFTHIYNHEDYKHLEVPGIKFVYYNWNLKDEYKDEGDLVIAHGHTHATCQNGIDENIDKISNFIEKYKPKFLWADEV